MVYRWADKEQACYQLYVREGKSLEEVMRVMKDEYHFAPSKRAFQVTFKRWNFPSKHNPAHRNEELVERIRQLWEANVGHKEMLEKLHEEGHEISERSMMRVRSRNRWLLRVPNGMRSYGDVNEVMENKEKRKRDHDREGSLEGEATEDAGMSLEGLVGGNIETSAANLDELNGPTTSNSDALPGAVMADFEMQRAERLAELKARSDELLATKKRRRRTRTWAGLPPDDPAPARFPSETTLDESKTYLHLSNEQYNQIRDEFQTICQEAGFVKKTAAGPERWQAAKDRLIGRNSHLHEQFHEQFDDIGPESKSLALDVICTDVTKRMRTAERGITLAEAKNILQINPTQSRTIRNEFYNILEADRFTGKLEAGNEHWATLKKEWIDNSEILQRILGFGDSDPQRAEKLRAVKVLSRDTMKRFRDDQNKGRHGAKRQLPTASALRLGSGIPHAKKQNKSDEAPLDTAGPFVSPPMRRVAQPVSRNQMRLNPMPPASPYTTSTLQIDPYLLARNACEEAQLNASTMDVEAQYNRYTADGRRPTPYASE